MITNILYKVSAVLILLCSNFIFSQDSYGISKEFHDRKREMLRSQMKENTVAVLFSYPIRNRSNTIDYVYHQNPNFYYLTGWKEPHAVIHHIGLDIHDPGNYSFLDFNMIVTVEPGIYIPEGSPCDPKWWSIGIRLEDDIFNHKRW